jgi:predicted transcriptional regulator of viral defense system
VRRVTKKEKIEKIIEKYNGYLITSLVCNEDISKTYIAKYIKEHGMEKVSRGVYITCDVWPDELFILQQRNSAIIYSGETALYLHGLIDREYSSVCVTVPQGYNASHLKNNDFVVSVKYAAPDFYKIGICEISSNSGNLVRVYDKERCICDLVMNRKKYEVQLFQTALKEYMSSNDKKLSQLIIYADMLGIRDEVMKYVEVLM